LFDAKHGYHTLSLEALVLRAAPKYRDLQYSGPWGEMPEVLLVPNHRSAALQYIEKATALYCSILTKDDARAGTIGICLLSNSAILRDTELVGYLTI
jgi:hypothetical protein